MDETESELRCPYCDDELLWGLFDPSEVQIGAHVHPMGCGVPSDGHEFRCRGCRKLIRFRWLRVERDGTPDLRWGLERTGQPKWWQIWR